VVEHTLGERLPAGRLPQRAVEPERFSDGEVRLNREHRRPDPLLLTEHLSAPRVQAAVDTTNGVFRALDLD
jgi:hypothetical protein